MPGQNDLGPFGAGVNETYNEPETFGDSGGGLYSWFKPCTGPTQEDGTKYTAQWANRVLKYIRRACDGMGIPRNEADGDRLLKAIQKADRAIDNVGTGSGVYKELAVSDGRHKLRSLKAGSGIAVALNEAGTEILISASGGGGGGGGGTPAPCLVGLTGDLTNISGCGVGIASATQQGFQIAHAFDNNDATRWAEPNGLPVTTAWIGWDFDPSNLGHVATINQATFKQFFNGGNQNDIWLAAVLESTSNMITWTPVATWSGLTHPGSDQYGPVESISFAAHTARAFRIRPTQVARYSSAIVLTQSSNIREVQFIKTA